MSAPDLSVSVYAELAWMRQVLTVLVDRGGGRVEIPRETLENMDRPLLYKLVTETTERGDLVLRVEEMLKEPTLLEQAAIALRDARSEMGDHDHPALTDLAGAIEALLEHLQAGSATKEQAV